MNFHSITLEDCEQFYYFKGIRTIFDGGEVIGFEKSIESKYDSNFVFRFIYCRKPKRECGIF